MKIYKSILTTAIACSLFAASTFAVEKAVTKDHKDYSKIEANLLVGVASDNLGLKTSCAFMLGEMKAENAIIPLTKVLRNDEDPRARIAAALALTKIGTERSIYVVKQAAQFDNFEKVRTTCDRFYKAHILSVNNQISIDKVKFADKTK